jgi:hypothetical protein
MRQFYLTYGVRLNTTQPAALNIAQKPSAKLSLAGTLGKSEKSSRISTPFFSYVGALNVSVIPDPIGNPEIFPSTDGLDSRFRGNDNIADCHSFTPHNRGIAFFSFLCLSIAGTY